MILIAPVENEKIIAESGLFLSTEMGKEFSKKMVSGELSFSKKMFPVHLPYEGLLKMNFGSHNHYAVTKEKWLQSNMPKQYQGEDLSGKKVVVFPMHGLGDQMYLAVSIRHIAEKYPGVSFHIVRSSISSAEKWYPYVYYNSFFNFTDPVLTWEGMQEYDYYINAEHFAHVENYKGAYPPAFYISCFLYHDAEDFFEKTPKLDVEKALAIYSKSPWPDTLQKLSDNGKPVVFVNSSTTGRVRDITESAVLELIEKACDDYSFIVSVYEKPELEKKITALKNPAVICTTRHPMVMAELIGIIANCDLALTPDSGITHIAEATKTPCGSVFNVVSPEERIAPYKFSEQLMVQFEIPGICKTPCYVHAVAKGKVCPGMAAVNENAGEMVCYQNAPCMEGLTGDHLWLLLNETAKLTGK